MKANRLVTVHGMFRSGTTLLARMLSAHEKSLVVSDPYVYFFKAFRNHIYRENGVRDHHYAMPMSDHFFDPNWVALERMLEADLRLEFPKDLFDLMIKEIIKWKNETHPKLIGSLGRLQRGTFSEVFLQLMNLLSDSYGTGHELVLGTKVSWSEACVPALARSFPAMKFVFTIRDPRAIVASQNAKKGFGSGKRPLLFYIRQWRKAASFYIWFRDFLDEVGHRSFFTSYEQLVRDPSRTANELCHFLNLDFEESTTDAKKYKDEGLFGKPWISNSSHAPKKAIDELSVDLWKEQLTLIEIQAIELLAGHEMRVLGYQSFAPAIELGAFVKGFPNPDFSEMPSWITEDRGVKNLVRSETHLDEFCKEALRLNLLESGGIDQQYLSKMLFFDPRVFERLRAG